MTVSRTAGEAGSGNVFADLELTDADAQVARAGPVTRIDALRTIAQSFLLRSRPGAVSGQALHASHRHAIRTGTPTATAQTAIANGPSSPAGSVTATAPGATPAVQAPRR